jgi:Penicillin binding protein transpeptidase domain
VAQKERKEYLPFNLRDHGWFTSFAPADAPRLVVSVFLEHGGSGHEAAPVAKAIYQKYFAREPNVPRAQQPRTAQSLPSAPASSVAPARYSAAAVPGAAPVLPAASTASHVSDH